ncbi:putative pentatricopeptide repeat-containing protein [Prunus yedoensis var. nudiflora]|uniref:Putative pentatricopeptide repeat-containing protein n=1 Tax=Prunus yedoensis var. nudiflora TaxID=2094558 RepID=A0A314YIT3_PRUYE|nr:putative pentatricopeptide repeat-containing protein [Prunus yedoensis var. nudiflora]
MVRCFLLFTPSHPCRRVPRRSNHAFSTFTASSPFVSDPPPSDASLFFKSQNPTRPLNPLQSSFDQYESSQPQLKAPPFSPHFTDTNNGTYGIFLVDTETRVPQMMR